MLFHSQVFILGFLPLVVALYYAVAQRPAARAWVLIVASWAFYAYWDPRLLPLLVLSVTANWCLSRLTERVTGRTLIAAGVILNLGLLGFFKYADFFGGTIAAITGQTFTPWGIVLPLGISFFTLQQISYLVDRRRGTAPLYGFRDYALYVSFFPQLIAGPIVRHNEIMHQYRESPTRPGLDERISRGLTLFVIGLVKKTLIADELARIADPVFAAAAAGAPVGFADGWIAMLAFGLQIYFDFSAYSDMALGLGALFGLSLPVNFNAPYRATSIREFWHRWHMTLSRFLRDYLYVPLGGNRHGPARQMAAVAAVMLIGGLWHGAAWTFVVWGAVHGAALVVNHAWRRFGPPLPRWLGWLLTMAVVFAAFVVFRATSFEAAQAVLVAVAGAEGWSLALDHATEGHRWLVPVAAAICLLLPTSQRIALEALPPRRAAGALAALVLVFTTIKGGGEYYSEFIYFQF